MRLTLTESGLDRFERSLESINMEEVKRRGVKNTAEELTERVQQNIRESDIQSPSRTMSKWYRNAEPDERTEGPAMVRSAAWQVDKVDGETYRVRPHPSVRKRATILEYKTRPPMTLGRASPMMLRGFRIKGEPQFAEQADSSGEHRFWRDSLKELISEQRLEYHLEQEFDKQLKEAGFL